MTEQREIAKMRSVLEADVLRVTEHGQTDFSAKFSICTRFQVAQSLREAGNINLLSGIWLASFPSLIVVQWFRTKLIILDKWFFYMHGKVL